MACASLTKLIDLKRESTLQEGPFQPEATMESKKTEQKDGKRGKANNSVFIAYAIFVFSALAIGLAVILLRSRA